MYSVISVIADLLPANTKMMAIDLFVGNQSVIFSFLGGDVYFMYILCTHFMCIFLVFFSCVYEIYMYTRGDISCTSYLHISYTSSSSSFHV